MSVDNAHSRHPRCAYFSELQQMDATPYEWVHGQVWHLHLAIDDASGIVTGAWFDTQETHLKITTMYLNRSLLIMVSNLSLKCNRLKKSTLLWQF